MLFTPSEMMTVYENDVITVVGSTIRGPTGSVVNGNGTQSKMVFRARQIGVYNVEGSPQVSTITVRSAVDAHQCVVSPIPKIAPIIVPIIVYVKAYTRTGEAKITGGDTVALEAVRGTCVITVQDVGTGVYKCTIVPQSNGTLDMRITINGERIGLLYHTQVIPPPKKWYLYCCCCW